jgi:hypothetical protein
LIGSYMRSMVLTRMKSSSLKKKLSRWSESIQKIKMLCEVLKWKHVVLVNVSVLKICLYSLPLKVEKEIH